MAHTFLLEIGLEEMPAEVITPAVEQLKEKTDRFLNEANLSYDSIQTFSTPRRLAIKITNLANRQPDETVTVKGPAKRIAQDEEGNWTKAAIGFTKGQGTTVEDIVFKEVKGEEYVFVEKYIQGKKTSEILKDLDTVVSSLNFPLTMKWGSTSYRYIRPIHWIVALFDNEVIPFNVFDIDTGNVSQGHRFLGEDILLKEAETYETSLEEQFVLANRNERQQMIVNQIEQLCEENNWQSPLSNQELLNEVTDLVEYPTAFYGSFKAEFLEVPEEVLETAMADHQRYFPVRKNSRQAKFLPYFIGVRNGNSEYIESVVKGNEKVLTARLADATFFYEEDNKLAIEDCVDKLKRVTFQEKLGSLYDKQVRVGKIANLLADDFDAKEKEQLQRAADIYKFDLVTNTVIEFTNLQGHIGAIYAEERGEHHEVVEAIRQQYMPVSIDSLVPYTKIGATLALADKFDTLMLFFAMGIVPSGSNDPYALRRSAMGIVRILEQYDQHLSLEFILEEMIEAIDVREELKTGFRKYKGSFLDFIKDRINQRLQKKIPYDIRQAILHGDQDDVVLMIDTANTLNEAKEKSDYKNIVESLTRVVNLAKKAPEEIEVDEALFETNSEKELLQRTVEAERVFHYSTQSEKRYNALKELSLPIDVFFDESMVMADNEAIKHNRLALLKKINNLTMRFANFSELVIK